MEFPLSELKSLLSVLEEGGAHEFEYEDEQKKIRVVMARGAPIVTTTAFAAPAAPVAAAPLASAAAAPAAAADDPNVVFITSPFVGTFYRAPSPEAPSFVSPGTTIKPGQTLCIVEAMKLMNEIEAEISGTVLDVLVENGHSVEFGQKLFKVKKS
jgi:acetyl-CoA carboxylase biotin carboxyl carrier protein